MASNSDKDGYKDRNKDNTKDRRIRILQVNKLYYPEIGGIEKTLQQICEGLNSWVDIQVLVSRKKGKTQDEVVNGVNLHRSSSLGTLASLPISPSFMLDFRKMAKQADIVHIHTPFPLGDLACVLSGYKGKVVVYWHSDVVRQKRLMVLYKPIMNMFLKRADIILVGAYGIVKGSKYLLPYKDKCVVVPFAVEDKILNAGATVVEQHGYLRNNKRIRFLFIGRLVYYKGCKVLLEAFATMKIDAELVMVGDGVLKIELLERSEELGILDKVSFLGKATPDKLKEEFENADVFVLPSVERSEAFALVQLEAMSYGLPVINTNLQSGVPEVSIHEKTGLTVEPESVEELAEAMDRLARDKEEREQFGKAGRMRVLETYTEEIMMENLKRVYNDLLYGVNGG